MTKEKAESHPLSKDVSDLSEPGVLLESILARMPFGMIVINPRGIILHINDIARTLMALTLPAEKLPGTNIRDCTVHMEGFVEEFGRFIRTPVPSFSFDSVFIEERYLDIAAHLLQEGKGTLLIVRDITDVKELESNSVQAIIMSQENERRRIARELHDGIAPLLSSTKLELDMYLEEIKENDAKVPEDKLLNIRNTIDTISADLRDLSHSLIPRLLEEFGLYSAFQNMVSRLSSPSGVQIEFISNVNKHERIDRDVELNLFRCGQELLSNALKHSKAQKIVVQLIKHENSIILMVEDDGAGFDQNEVEADRGGIGLTNIETRVRTLNGDFLIESVRHRGTLVSIEIPI